MVHYDMKFGQTIENQFFTLTFFFLRSLREDLPHLPREKNKEEENYCQEEYPEPRVQ